MSRMTRPHRMTQLASITLVAAFAAGCSSSSGQYSYSSISKDITPELSTLTERPIDIDRSIAVNNNQNLRMMTSDWGRMFYTQQPSRLSPYPIIATSGQPF